MLSATIAANCLQARAKLGIESGDSMVIVLKMCSVTSRGKTGRREGLWVGPGAFARFCGKEDKVAIKASAPFQPSSSSRIVKSALRVTFVGDEDLSILTIMTCCRDRIQAFCVSPSDTILTTLAMAISATESLSKCVASEIRTFPFPTGIK